MQSKTCFIDIDATITNDGDIRQIDKKYPLHNALFNVLRDIMIQNGWEKEKATTALVQHANDIVFWDYKDFIHEFNLPEKHSMEKIVEWHNDHLIVYQDAVDMIKQLHALDIPLYIISNNPILGCLLKLQRAGLATLEGSPWFKDILGSNNIKGQKGAVDFWKRALAYTGISPEEIVMIGDNPKDDFEIPQQAGIKNFFLVDRKRSESIIRKGNLCLVNNLKYVVECFKNEAI